MDKSKILSGEELVARGVTRSNSSLPVVGVKDVTPNGSWLEQKQIESALEARKHLIEVPRIEKSGNISHATWREDLMLAEVTKQTGPHWQFLGHHVRKHLYLKPEEALHLMEMNSLLLKYNEVIVSLQQAYTLLLRGKVTPMKYQVYSSLSRVGYKVFQHEYKPVQIAKDSEEKKSDEQKNDVEIRNEALIECETGNLGGIESKKEQGKLNSTEEREIKVINVHVENKVEPMSVDENTEERSVADSQIEEETTSSGAQLESRSEDKDIDRESALKENMETQPEKEIVTESRSPETEQDNEKIKNDSNVHVSDLKKDNKNSNNLKEDSRSKDTNHLKNSSTQSKHGDESRTSDNSPEKIKEISEVNHSNGDQVLENNIIDVDSQDPQDKVKSNKTSKLVVIEVDEPLEAQENNDPVLIDSSTEMDLDKSSIVEIDSESDNLNENKVKPETNDNLETITKRKIRLLQKRKIRQTNTDILEKCFENVPDFYQKPVVTVNVPKEEFIPKHVFCNKTSYVLVTEDIQNTSKNRRSSVETRSYNETDEVNGAHIRRVRSSTESSRASEPVSVPTNFSTNPNQQRRFRPQPFSQSHFWRQRFLFPSNFAFAPNNFFPRFNFSPRHPFWRQSFNFPPYSTNSYGSNVNNAPRNTAKRNRKNKNSHLEAIKRLTQKLKSMVVAGATSMHNIEALQSLIQTYNIRYKTNIKLSNDYEIMDGDSILETIELDDEEEPEPKRRKTEKKTQKYEENFNGLKKLALKLKEMADKNVITSRHRRAFSHVVKEFNKTYDADVYMNENYQVIDRRFVTLDSSSESDCVVEETPVIDNPPRSLPSGKLVRNPFNILKGLSKRKDCPTGQVPTSIKDLGMTINDKSHRETLEKNFTENWLPKDDDFGKPEIVPRSFMQVIFMDSKKEEYLYDFIKNQNCEFDNWLDIKLAFFSSFVEEPLQCDGSIIEEDKCDIEPLISENDGLDIRGMLQKLSIIKNNKEIATESSLSVDFDVYNRDVQNFRKSNPPKPHFRVVCLSHLSPFPSNSEVAALHSKYSDNVPILFAIVCDGSVSYLQMNPIEIPVYLPSSDMDFT